MRARVIVFHGILCVDEALCPDVIVCSEAVLCHLAPNKLLSRQPMF